MFKNNLKRSQMLFWELRGTGKIVIFDLFFIIIFYFIYIQFTAAKSFQQTVYLILR